MRGSGSIRYYHFACMVSLIFCCFLKPGYVIGSDIDVDKALKIAVQKLDEAERRTKKASKIYESLQQGLYAYDQSLLEDLRKLQEELADHYQLVIRTRENVCNESSNAASSDVAVLRIAISRTTGLLKNQAGSVQAMTELRQQQVSLVKKARLRNAVDEADQLWVVADVSGLLKDAELSLDRAGNHTGLYYFAREQGIDLHKIKEECRNAIN